MISANKREGWQMAKEKILNPMFAASLHSLSSNYAREK